MGKVIPLKAKRAKSGETITLPLAYAQASEEAVDALSRLIDEGLSVESVRIAVAALKQHGRFEQKLPPEARKALDIWV